MDENADRHSMVDAAAENARDLERELDWFEEVLRARLRRYFETDEGGPALADIGPPDLEGRCSYYADFVRHYELTSAERLVVVLAMIPHIRPQALDVLWSKNAQTEREFSEFGGSRAAAHCGFLPTGETAAFILAGDDLAERFDAARLFDGSHVFSRHGILGLSAPGPGEPMLSGSLSMSREYLNWFTTGILRKPNYDSDFPARLIETALEWSDLVLPASTLEQLDEIKSWILYGRSLLEDFGMGGKLPPGFTSLFYGPPGTGKTLSACLLGKHCGCDVYKIDLGMVVSKYIGETEKNLAKVFDMAEHRRWILFFDEADALFGRRTKVDDSHDRYANQEISFLLQRIEDFSGVVILASNMRTNIDDAFLRRFQSVVGFPMPRPPERLRIWRSAFSPRTSLEPRLDIERVADRYEISGGTIMNVVRYSSLKALSRNDLVIRLEDVEEGVRKELSKEGRTV